MIDSHTHTRYSKHASGSITNLVESAIKNGIKILTITDHAPFYIDGNNRLLEYELNDYFTEIDDVKSIYSKEIKILSGLELDYIPGSESFSEKLTNQYSPDFIIGSLHYVPIKNDYVKVWDLKSLIDPAVIDAYFECHVDMVNSGLFDSIGHPDSISRRVHDNQLKSYWDNLLMCFSKKNVAWELNASGLRKSAYNSATDSYEVNQHGFPSLYVMSQLKEYNINLTIGSDAHNPNDVGKGIVNVMELMKNNGLEHVNYYIKRKACRVSLESLVK